MFQYVNNYHEATVMIDRGPFGLCGYNQFSPTKKQYEAICWWWFVEYVRPLALVLA